MPVPDNDHTHAGCICGNCPSYPGDDPWTYCASGKSAKPIEQNGCICPSCPIYKEFGIDGMYFCVNGVAE